MASPKFSLQRIKEAVIFKTHNTKLYSALKTFFRSMDMSWGNTETAHAQMLEGKPIIVLGQKFFDTQVQSEEEAAEVVLHEIMHHLFQHLHRLEKGELKTHDFRHVHLAMDAMVNAYLHQENCAGFMERYYDDLDEYAFLRPGSREFKLTQGKWPFQKILPAYKVSYDLFHEFEDFYVRKIQRLGGTLEEAIAFFETHFPNPPKKDSPKLLGNPKGLTTGKPNEMSPSNVFGSNEAEQILRQLGLKHASEEAKNNFAEVIRKITTVVKKPGNVLYGRYQSRRVPAKLSRRDILRVERGMLLFDRTEYRTQEVWIFFDDSGSMKDYRQFIVDLAKTLSSFAVKVHAIVWAEEITEFPYSKLIKGEFPNVGGGTDGEVVAKYIRDNQIAQAVIVTDNVAGGLQTKIEAQVFLCLVKGSDTEGSFSDKRKVPHCQKYWLEI